MVSADAMPVEIVQFCWKYNLERLQKLPELEGSEAKLRMAGDKPYVTDNSNYIVDLYFQKPIKDAHAAAKAIAKLTGAPAGAQLHMTGSAHALPVCLSEIAQALQHGALKTPSGGGTHLCCMTIGILHVDWDVVEN
jgi:hypothetical protein